MLLSDKERQDINDIMRADMNAEQRVMAFAERVIMEELGGASYAADAGAIAAVLDRVSELEAALRAMLATEFAEECQECGIGHTEAWERAKALVAKDKQEAQ